MGYRPPKPKRREYGSWEDYQNAVDIWRALYFSKNLSNGTTIYGSKPTEGRPGHKHGHSGSDFDRSPHSTIGSAAIGDAHTYDEHKDERTKRW